MKTLFKSGVALALGLLLYGGTAQAQVTVSVNVPYWGPAVGPGVQYYYLPEIDGYYDLYSGLYLFFDPVYGSWVSSPVLPRAYAGYDPRFFHPVAIQYVGRQPWGYLRDHRLYCDRWGVVPGRYYGANWPGRDYVVAPRPAYGPGGGYYNSPYNRNGYARGDYRNGYRDNRGDYRGNGYGGYNNRRDDNRPGNYGGYNGGPGRNGNRGDYDRRDQYERGAPPAPSAPTPQPERGAGGYNGGGRGRGR